MVLGVPGLMMRRNMVMSWWFSTQSRLRQTVLLLAHLPAGEALAVRIRAFLILALSWAALPHQSFKK